MLANGATLQQIALVLEVSVKTLYRYITAGRQREIINLSADGSANPLQMQRPG
ncbi:hypothetical protein [Pantoea sp. UBA7232]|uniref:hypothetical protein n=1 Tax=Pantoea sp. UBA7232 TaxID=1947045 RepID=UPI002598CE23|nr:hypothetical protein [Pantoea sp. UBA7232]